MSTLKASKKLDSILFRAHKTQLPKISKQSSTRHITTSAQKEREIYPVNK